jgi:hypothetical protein
MSFRSMLVQTATINSQRQRLADVDAEGNPVTSSTPRSVPCLLQRDVRRLTQEEADLGRTEPASEWLLFLMPDVVIDADDSVTVDGAGYQVVGEPERLISPRLRGVHHIEARLRKVG